MARFEKILISGVSMKNSFSFRPESRRCGTLFGILMLAGMGLFLSGQNGIPALGGVVMDPDEVEWASVRDYTGAEFDADFDARKDDEILIDIEVRELSGQQSVSGVWQQNFDGRSWVMHRGLTSSEFGDKWVEYNDEGHRLIDQESYVLGSARYYAGIWIENPEGYAWASYRNLTHSSISAYSELLADEYILVDFDAYAMGKATRYAGVWVENDKGLEWMLRRDLTSAEFSDDFSAYQDLYRIHDIESYQVDGEQRYAAIWIKNNNDRAWNENHDLSAGDYRNHWLRYRDQGFRLTDFEQYETIAGTRYAGVWRQNTGRPDWPLRPTIDAIANAHLEEHDIPGMGIAIVNQGTIEYMRGFGHQDVASGAWYSAHTINRLASVSKAVAGVLLLKLDDQGEIDSSAPTRDYAAELPGHHTHTLEQLTSNRGGVGHYPELGLGTMYTQYDTAMDAAELFWDEALVCIPGTCYDYSTHGYTLLGAGIEGATGDAIDEVLYTQLGSGLGLPTLRAEDRGVASEFRTTLYDTDNTEATPDNISWKLLGGGMEASTYDLVRFSEMLMGGQILPDEAFEKLWTIPEPTSASYAMGWSVGTLQGVFSIRKDGSQLGANTYVRLFPELELAVVVLINRRSSYPGSLSSDIANAILPTLPPVITEEPQGQTAHVGLNLSFSVAATSSEPLSYQWRKNGVGLPGATDSTLVVRTKNRGVSGLYSVLVSNSVSSVVSSMAALYVLIPQHLEPLEKLDGEGFRLRFGDYDGYPLQDADKDNFIVQWSTDLTQWMDLTGTPRNVVDGRVVLDDPGAGESVHKSYRVTEY